MDYLVKALALNKNVRVYAVNNTGVVNEAIRRHDIWPSGASVLGKTMAIGLMMGGMLKGKQALTIKIDGNGPIGQVVVDANALGDVRGYVTRPHVNFTTNDGKLAEVQTLGYNGFIDVIKDLKMNDLFTSSIDIVTGDLAKDFTYYFMESEQTPSVVALGSKFDVDNTCLLCGGIIIQLMPGASEEDILYVESKLHMLNNFSVLLEKYKLEEIVKMLFEDAEIVETRTVIFHCKCSKQKFAGGLISLGKDELQNIIETDKKAEAVCHYCNESYEFSLEELIELVKEAK